MTETAKELWDDEDFIYERYIEQEEWIRMYLKKQFHSPERRREVILSAFYYRRQFRNRLIEMGWTYEGDGHFYGPEE